MSSLDRLNSLLRDSAKGDVSAFEEFVKLTKDQLYAYVLGLVPSIHAEDVVQDTYMRLWKAKPSYDFHRSAKTFLFTLAYRSSIDLLRSTSRETKKVDALKTAVKENVHPISSEEPGIDLSRLSNEQRDVILLVVVAGFSYMETAEIVGVSSQTVKSRLHEARKRLSEQLKEKSIRTKRGKLA